MLSYRLTCVFVTGDVIESGECSGTFDTTEEASTTQISEAGGVEGLEGHDGPEHVHAQTVMTKCL